MKCLNNPGSSNIVTSFNPNSGKIFWNFSQMRICSGRVSALTVSMETIMQIFNSFSWMPCDKFRIIIAFVSQNIMQGKQYKMFQRYRLLATCNFWTSWHWLERIKWHKMRYPYCSQETHFQSCALRKKTRSGQMIPEKQYAT